MVACEHRHLRSLLYVTLADAFQSLHIDEIYHGILKMQDCEVLYLSDRPEKLIITHLAVPPVAIRPSVEMDSAAGR
jgi:DNA-directed RNA polymerase beta' subunit